MTERILVTGATGKTGDSVVQFLRRRKADVRAGTRNPRAPGDVRFDWRDQATHGPALQGAAPILTGPEALSDDDVVKAISNVANRSIRHMNLSSAELRALYKQIGLPSEHASILSDLDEAIARGAENRVTNEVERSLHRKPTHFVEFLENNKSGFGPDPRKRSASAV